MAEKRWVTGAELLDSGQFQIFELVELIRTERLPAYDQMTGFRVLDITTQQRELAYHTIEEARAAVPKIRDKIGFESNWSRKGKAYLKGLSPLESLEHDEVFAQMMFDGKIKQYPKNTHQFDFNVEHHRNDLQHFENTVRGLIFKIQDIAELKTDALTASDRAESKVNDELILEKAKSVLATLKGKDMEYVEAWIKRLENHWDINALAEHLKLSGRSAQRYCTEAKRIVMGTP